MIFHIAKLENISNITGMKSLSSISEVINLWPTRDALRLAMLPHLGDDSGLTTDRNHKWASADRVPAPHHQALIKAAQDYGIAHVTAELVVRLHAKEGVCSS